MKYSVVLRQDEEGNWLATVPALPGCHTWGGTRAEALANAREAIEGCIESLRASGDPVPQEEPAVELAVVTIS
jgi:predicted RNase H-like HicB family nuclease